MGRTFDACSLSLLQSSSLLNPASGSPALCSARSCNLPFALPALAARPLFCHGRLVGLGSVGRCFAAALFSKKLEKSLLRVAFFLIFAADQNLAAWMKKHEKRSGCMRGKRSPP